jgi:hypothetical protein
MCPESMFVLMLCDPLKDCRPCSFHKFYDMIKNSDHHKIVRAARINVFY